MRLAARLSPKPPAAEACAAAPFRMAEMSAFSAPPSRVKNLKPLRWNGRWLARDHDRAVVLVPCGRVQWDVLADQSKSTTYGFRALGTADQQSICDAHLEREFGFASQPASPASQVQMSARQRTDRCTEFQWLRAGCMALSAEHHPSASQDSACQAAVALACVLH